MITSGLVRAVLDVQAQQIHVEQIDQATVPPGYMFRVHLPHPTHFPRDGSWIEARWEIIPAPGLHAWYLRWRYPSKVVD